MKKILIALIIFIALPAYARDWNDKVAAGVGSGLSGDTEAGTPTGIWDFTTIKLNGVLLGDASGVYFGDVEGGNFNGLNRSQSGISPYNNPISGITLTGADLNSDMIIQSDTYIGLPTAAIVGGVSRWFMKFTIGAGGGALEVGTFSTGSSEPVQGTDGGTWFTATTGFIIPSGNQGATVTIRSGDTTYVFAEGSSAVSPFK